MTWHIDEGMDLLSENDLYYSQLLLISFALWAIVIVLVSRYTKVIENLLSEPKAFVYKCQPKERPPPEAFERI